MGRETTSFTLAFFRLPLSSSALGNTEQTSGPGAAGPLQHCAVSPAAAFLLDSGPMCPRPSPTPARLLAAFLQLVSALGIPHPHPQQHSCLRDSSPKANCHSAFWNSNLMGCSIFLFAKPSNSKQRPLNSRDSKSYPTPRVAPVLNQSWSSYFPGLTD